MTFKVTSGWTGSRIFRLAVVDIPIQCGHFRSERALYKAKREKQLIDTL